MLASIYDPTFLQERGLTGYLQHLSRSLDAPVIFAEVFDLTAKAVTESWRNVYPFAVSYEEVALHNPRHRNGFPRPGLVFSDARLLSESEIARSHFHNEILPAAGIGDFVGGCEHLDRNRLCALTFSFDSRIDTSQGHLFERYALAFRHVQNFLAIQTECFRRSLVATGSSATVFFRLDRGLRIIERLTKSETMHAEASRWVSDLRGEFRIRDQTAHAVLCRYFSRLRDDDEAWQLMPALRLPLAGGATLRIVSSNAVAMSGLLPHADVWVALDVPERRLSSVEPLSRSYGLTPAEARVLECLLQGASRAGIARQRGVARETVKSQTASIFGKMDVADQKELMRRFS